MNASFKIMNFIAPGSEVLVLGRGSNDYIVKMHDFVLKSSLVFLNIEQMNYNKIVMTRKNAISQIVKFIAPGPGFW